MLFTFKISDLDTFWGIGYNFNNLKSQFCYLFVSFNLENYLSYHDFFYI